MRISNDFRIFWLKNYRQAICFFEKSPLSMPLVYGDRLVMGKLPFVTP